MRMNICQQTCKYLALTCTLEPLILFSESYHDANQIKGNEAYNHTLANSLSLQTYPTLRWGQNVKAFYYFVFFAEIISFCISKE